MTTRSSTRTGPLAWFQQILDRLFLGVLLLSPLAIGGVPPEMQVWISVAVLAVGLPIITLHCVSGRSHRTHMLTWVLLALGLWTLLRELPFLGFLGAEVHRLVDGLWPDHRLGLLIAPAYGPLFALRTFALVVTLQVAALRFISSEKRDTLALTILGASALAMGVGVAQQMADARVILGWYTPVQPYALQGLSGPFVNPNQATALYALGPLLAVSWGIARKWTKLPLFAWTLLLVATACAIHFESRAVLLAIVLGTGTTMLTRRLPRHENRRALRTPVFFLTTAMVLIVALVLLGGVVVHLEGQPIESDRGVRKALLWHDLWSVFALAPWSGVGPGATQELLPWVSGRTRLLQFHTESMPLQVLVDHGILWALLILAALLRPLWLAARTTNVSTQRFMALFSTLVFIGTEAVAGMAMHALSYTLLVGAWWGAMVPVASDRREDPDAPPSSRWPRAQGWVLLIICLVGSSIALQGLNRSFPWVNDESTMPMAETLSSSPLPWDRIDAEQRAWTRAAPANNDLIGQSVRIALMRGDTERALELVDFLDINVPFYRGRGRVHLMIARREGDPVRACQGLALSHRNQRRLSRDDFFLLGTDVALWRPCLEAHEELWLVAYHLLRQDTDAIRLIHLAESHLADTPDHIPSLHAVSLRYVKNRLYGPAKLRAEQWFVLAPEDLDALATLAQALHGSGDAEGAWELLHDARDRIASGHTFAALHYLELSVQRLWESELPQAALHREVDALREVARILEAQLRRSNPRVSRVLAECAMLVEDWTEARMRVDEFRRRGGAVHGAERLLERIEAGRAQQDIERRLQRRAP